MGFDIGVVSLEREVGLELASSIGSCRIHFFYKDDILERVYGVHGLIIQHFSEKNYDKLFELVFLLKNKTAVPIWILSKEMNTISRFVSLQLGVLGHFSHRIDSEELFLVIENTLQLMYTIETTRNRQIFNSVNKIKLKEPNSSLIMESGLEISLTQLEYRMLSVLFSHPNQVFTYEAIYEQLWGKKESSKGKQCRIANLAFKVRNKLKSHNENPKILKTVRSVGYLWDVNLNSKC